jgi:hypothetical protein
MTPRTTINFFRSRTGAFLLFLVLLLIGYVLVNGFKAPDFRRLEREEGTTSMADKSERKSQVVETVTRDMTAFNPPNETATPAKVTPAPSLQKQEKPPELPPISLYAETPTAEKPQEEFGDEFAPFGRLVRCELIITVDSSAITTPIVGLVTEDVWHNSHLIIPAGTEIHGSAMVDRVRERIASSGGWTFVWRTGEELTVSGLALDREREQESEGWGITDGSAGLRGQLVKSDDMAEIKLFTASFLSGAASGLTEKEQTVFGSQAVPSLQNAPFVGAQRVLDTYAKQIYDTIQRDGFYVRVPAGKQFYVYVTQTIDKSRAVIGGTRFSTLASADEPEKENPNDPLNHLRQNLRRIYSPATERQPSGTPRLQTPEALLPKLPTR